MIFDNENLFTGLGKIFMKDFIEIASKESRGEGYEIFYEGDPATHFYIMIEGKVELSIKKGKHDVFTIQRPGEIFGWSSLVGGNEYSATAVCKKPSVLLAVERQLLEDLLEKHPKCGFVFFKKMAEALGKRLIEAYKIIHERG